MKILGFDGNTDFYSNFHTCSFIYNGVQFDNSEKAFQYAKVDDSDFVSKKNILAAPTPGKCKRLGRKCKMRPDWENIKLSVMHDIVYQKFIQNPDLMEKLLSNDAYLEETNTWNDRYWGCCPAGNGENHLGKILMQVREELKGMV